jgi:hypothetical protein
VIIDFARLLYYRDSKKMMRVIRRNGNELPEEVVKNCPT